MGFARFSPLFLLLALPVSAVCQTAPPAPGLNFLYHLNSTLGETLSFGPGPSGTQLSIPILGGTLTGPRISGKMAYMYVVDEVKYILTYLPGKVMDVGADWGTIDTNGTFQANAQYQVQTDDGANIFVHVTGPTQPNGQVYNHITFSTGSEKYYWMNNIVAVGISTLGTTSVAVDAWEMVAPS